MSDISTMETKITTQDGPESAVGAGNETGGTEKLADKKPGIEEDTSFENVNKIANGNIKKIIDDGEEALKLPPYETGVINEGKKYGLGGSNFDQYQQEIFDLVETKATEIKNIQNEGILPPNQDPIQNLIEKNNPDMLNPESTSYEEYSNLQEFKNNHSEDYDNLIKLADPSLSPENFIASIQEINKGKGNEILSGSGNYKSFSLPLDTEGRKLRVNYYENGYVDVRGQIEQGGEQGPATPETGELPQETEAQISPEDAGNDTEEEGSTLEDIDDSVEMDQTEQLNEFVEKISDLLDLQKELLQTTIDGIEKTWQQEIMKGITSEQLEEFMKGIGQNLDKQPFMNFLNSLNAMLSQFEKMGNEQKDRTKEIMKLMLIVAVKISAKLVATAARNIAKSADKDDKVTQVIFGSIADITDKGAGIVAGRESLGENIQQIYKNLKGERV